MLWEQEPQARVSIAFSSSPSFHDIGIHKCSSGRQLKRHFDVIFECITATRDFVYS